SDGEYCGDAPWNCGYNKRWETDNTYSLSVNESFNQQQIAKNNNVRNAIFGSYNTAFGQSSQAGNAVSNSSVALETKVYLGGTELNSSNWYGSLGLTNQVQVQTKYKYIDTAMQANQNFWSGLAGQFTSIASTFLSLVNPLKDWEERSADYEEEYQAKLLELEQTKQSTIQNYNDQIAAMKAARGAWVTEVYGYQMAGIEGSQDNANSQYRTGQENWDNTINVFQQVELNWYLSAKDTLQQAVTAPNGETQYQTNAIPQANQIQTQITNSETNTTQLYNAATGLYQTYQYAAAGNVMQQALTNQQNQTSWNQQGAALSQTIADSFGRSEAYKTAELGASNRINALAQTIYGNGAYIVDNTELNQIQTQITTNGQNQSFWQNEINGTNGGFNFNGRNNTSQTKEALYGDMIADIAVATTLQAEVVDEEITYLKTANEYFEKSERYQELADKAKSEAKFDEAALYTGYAVREKNNAVGFLKKKYYNLGEEITSEVDNRGLTFTKNSFLSYRDTLLSKNFQNTAQIGKQIQEGKNQVAGIIAEGESYNQIQGMIQTAANLNKQGEENKERVERLLLESKELANRDIGGGLLDGLQEMIASIQSSLPQEISNNGVAQYIQNQEKELAEKQEKVNELLSHMNSLVTNQNDLSNLQTLLQGSSQAINLAANSAVSKYLDDYAKKLQKDNEERSTQLQKTLLTALENGDEYKYLREAGYGFRTDGEGISAYRQIYSGEIEIGGSAMKETSYSPNLEYQYIRIETKFNPGNLSVDMMNPNSTRFNAEMAIGVKNYIDNLQKNVEQMFAQFSDKTNEIKEEYAQNQEIQDYKKELYKESKSNILASFQALPEDLKKAFSGEMGGLKGYHEQGSKYNFNQESFKDESGEMKKIGKSMYEGANIDDTVFGGSRELKGSVSVKGIPVEVSYGMQYLIVTSGFNISNLGHNFNLKLVGNQNAESQLSTVNQKYEIYKEDIQNRIEKQAKANDAEKESKGFLFNVLNGMSGGQKVGQAVEGEIRSRVTGAIAEATGLPASLVGALVGGANMKQAMKAYEKSVTTEAISQATGIPAWYLNQKISEKEATHAMSTSFSYNMGRSLTAVAQFGLSVVKTYASVVAPSTSGQLERLTDRMNKFADHIGQQFYENRETIDTVVTVTAVVGAAFSFGTSMAALAAYKVAEGATQGGVYGALAGAVSTAGTAASVFTAGTIGFDCSYSYADGFGASVGVGYKFMEGLGVGATLSYNEQSGFGASAGLQAGTSRLNINAGLSYSERDGVSGNVGLNYGLGKDPKAGLSLGMSYNRQDGMGASVGLTSKGGILRDTGANITRTEYSGFGADISSREYGPGKFSGGLSYNQRDGFTASLNVAGTNALNYNSQTGLSSNTEFISQYSMNRGMSEDSTQTDTEAESRAAQERNNQESGKSVLDGFGFASTRREDEDYSQNHGDIDNDGKSKGSGIDPTKLEVNQYDRIQNRDGAGENLSKKIDETFNAKQGKDEKLHKEFTAEIDLRRSQVADNEKNMSLGDKMKLDKLKDQKAALDAEYKAINSGGGKNDKYNEVLLLKIEAVNHQMNDMKAGDAFKFKGENADNRTQLMGRMIELKEKAVYGTLTANEKKDLAKVTGGLEDYRRYGQVRDLVLNNKISSYDLGSSTTAAICFVNSHSNYGGVDTKTNYFAQAQLGNIGMTNSDYRGMKAPALGVGSHWSGDLTTLRNPASSEVHVTRSNVDILNQSKANNAIVFTDTTGDGNANHWQNVARGEDGKWYNLNNNRRTKDDVAPMDFSKVYQIKYNDNW
ncbi:hypothetical protein, partial [Leptospira weilii]|uniref:hypothetical protein n=1 Tax=Leptospira weilii TaxID=28184 RepID=UPI00077331DB